MNPKVGYGIAAVLGVTSLTRLGHNPFLTHSNMKAFWAFAVVAVVVAVITLIAGSTSEPQTRSR